MLNVENSVREHKDVQRIFPLRPAEEVAEQAEQIKGYLDGREKPLLLTQDEFAQLTSFESDLSRQLAPIAKLSIKSQLIYLDFFLTETGRNMLQEDFRGEDIPQDIEGLKRFFYDKQDFFNDKANAKLKQKYESDSMKATNAQLCKTLLPEGSLDGKLNVGAAKAPQVVTVILNGDVLQRKWETLRALRKELRLLEGNNAKSAETDNLRAAKKEIIQMYRHRINEMLMLLYGDLYLLKSKEQLVGKEGLKPEERSLTATIPGFGKLERSLSMLDKMLRGVGEKEGDDYNQVSAATRQAAREIIDILRPKTDASRDNALRERGIDPQKLHAPENYISPAERAVWGNALLYSLGWLSSEPVTPNTLDRAGPAADGKWQFVPGTTAAMAMDSTKRIIRDANKPRPVDASLVLALEHETLGHAQQAQNRQAIGLEIFETTQTDRRTVLAESGAVHNEREANKAIFGSDRFSIGVDSIPGLEARLQGKTYLECVEVIYESKMKAIRSRCDLTQSDQRAKFLAIARKELDDVIERTKRLFRSTETKFIGFDKTAQYITNSQEAAYTEQEIVYDKLKELGLEKLAYIGLNLRTVLALLKLGLLDLSKVHVPESYASKLWEEGGIGANGEVIEPVKNKFLLDS